MSTGLTVGAWFASAAIKRLVELASSSAMEQWGLQIGLQDDIRKLRFALMRVQILLNIAERKRAEEGGDLNELLRELKDITEDADDLLDEFEYDVVRAKVEGENLQASNPFSLSVITHHAKEFLNAGEVASKVKEIHSRLDIVADGVSSILPLLESNVTAAQQEMPERETSPFPNLSDQFVGREAEVENIVDLLLNSSDGYGSSTDMKNPGVLAVIGIGGVGKTALAQHVYNHRTIQHHFKLTMWVCVSENFDVKRLLKDMIEAAGLERPNNESLYALQQKIRQIILGKRFLLVLDDVWNDDRNKWERLCASLAFGSQESKILTTTRLEQVASMMCTMETPIHLEGLADDAYWAFFKSCTFGSSNCEGYPKLVPICMTIAKRLRGSPLAAKTLGSLLSRELDETYWKSIMNSKLWEIRQDQNDIMPVLRLSYKHLPGHLKQCFAYCSLFPKDHRFSEVELVQMWMAQGFIGEDSSKRPEDVGSQYCQELVMRSFFQKCSRPFEGEWLEVHDLLNDLTQYVSSKECHRIENGKLESISDTIRHLSVHWEMGAFKDLCKFKKLRTLVFWDIVKLDSNTWKALHEVFTELTSIRVLSIVRCNLTELPESIGKLKHLRYLDISGNWNIMLPKSLCRLYNLRVLDMRGCSITNVPDGISNLIYLRHLYAEDDVISKIAGIGKLTSLQTLSSYIVKKENGHKITELRDLKELRGCLRIRNLENVEDKKEATGADLKGKPHIDELRLSWWSSDSTTDRDIDTDEEVLEGLEPHPNIKSLKIVGYWGLRTPSWVNTQHLSNLKCLQLKNCRSWGCLPLLGQLPSLKSPSFESCPAIKKIGDEFHYNGDIKGFSSLETLEFDGMQGEGNQLLFPVLREVTIRECPNLRHISIHLPLSLTRLSITDCEELMYMPIERLKHLVSLEHLFLSGCPKLGSSMAMVAQHQVDEEEDHVEDNNIQQLLPSSLTRLILSSCGYLCSSGFVPRCLRNLTSLQTLKIANCPHITSFPKDVMSRLTALEDLDIYDCQDLMTLEGLQALPSSVQSLSIKNCPKLLPLAAASRPEGGDDQQYAFPSLSYLNVDDTSLLTLQPLRGSLPSLRVLSIVGSLQSTMFTAGAEEQEDSLLLQNLTSLQSLYFIKCGNLQSLPPEQHTLSSLKELSVWYCPKIQSLPEKGLPASLTDLHMEGCHPVLKERCQKETGADWSKIAHINDVDIS